SFGASLDQHVSLVAGNCTVHLYGLSYSAPSHQWSYGCTHETSPSHRHGGKSVFPSYLGVFLGSHQRQESTSPHGQLCAISSIGDCAAAHAHGGASTPWFYLQRWTPVSPSACWWSSLVSFTRASRRAGIGGE